MHVANRSDRVESFISAIDAYQPRLSATPADEFRVFARFLSRSIDGRYLDRHPPRELLYDIEKLLQSSLVQGDDQIAITIEASPDDPRRGTLHKCCPDQPFLYSIVSLTLDQLGVKMFRAINCVIPVERRKDSCLISVGRSDSMNESFVWVEIECENVRQRAAEIESTLRTRIGQLRDSVRDFDEMKRCISHVASGLEAKGVSTTTEHSVALTDGARFLRWLSDEHFILLGTKFVPSLGRDEQMFEPCGTGKHGDWSSLEREAHERLESGSFFPYVSLHKSRNASWVYRPGRTDYIIATQFDRSGNPDGFFLIEGLFSFKASAEPRTDIPLLDRVIDELYAEMEATKGTHRFRTIRNAFNSLPLEYLFSLKREDVREIVERVLEADSERRLRIHVSTDSFQSSAFVFVALPRSHYNDELRSEIRRLLKGSFSATSIDDGIYAGDTDSVTFHYFMTGVDSIGEERQTELARAIDRMASPWSARLMEALSSRFDTNEARRLHSLYGEAFDSRYQEETSITRTVNDIELLEDLGKSKNFDCEIFREQSDEPIDITRLRLYENRPIFLSKILPILENFGLIVIDQFPTRIHVPGRAEQRISTFRLKGFDGTKVDLMSRRRRLRRAIRGVVDGQLANEPLNRLLLRADIPWNYVALMGAYTYYARQIGIQFGLVTIRDVLLRHGDIVRALTELFRARFDPDYGGLNSTEVNKERLSVIQRSHARLDQLLDGVNDLVSDQVLRWFSNLIEATVRTNFYNREPQDAHVSLKFDPSKITRIPEPRPYREVYVHHPQVSGLHLRGGPIARGGLRWSDRPLDYRTEVLGLMATQVLKNVLIVPTGAKGAFVLQNPPSELSLRRGKADEMYKVFVRGILDVSDNVIDGTTVTPKRTIRYEDDDPYLVVAADKGTAHLSDTANSVAAARNFWLGDAFASGGSNGYDHKKEGITARGAWECVRRHFWELGIDPQKQEFSVAGIGDMSGDVFGNGLLRSRKAKLVAAFDHRHVFLDPNPDPETSYLAREALFARSRSSWADYPKDAMSAGAGIYSRKAKAIQLSTEASDLLELDQTEISGIDLVKAVLRLRVDLLWNGGIGTYIKSSEETHFDAGDSANDLVRVDASEVRARIIGEGGNLGITQRGRVELALAGIALNTDAIDNSAGVDLSDHEVNLKTLLKAPVQRSELTEKERVGWLESLKDEVCTMVLRNNWHQSRMISLDVLRSMHDPARFLRAIEFLCQALGTTRQTMSLPSEAELMERHKRGLGLARPEAAVLAALAKQHLRKELGQSSQWSMPTIQSDLRTYFPQRVSHEFPRDVEEHPLATEVGHTMVINHIINDTGATWLSETLLRTGGQTDEVISARFAIIRMLDIDKIKASIEQLELQVPARVEYRLRLVTEHAVERATDWLLRRGTLPSHDFSARVRTALGSVIRSLNAEQRNALARWQNELAEAGSVAQTVMGVAAMDQAIDIASVSVASRLPLEKMDQAADVLRVVGETSGLASILGQSFPEDEPGNETPASTALRARIRRDLVELASTIACRDHTPLSGDTRAYLSAIRDDIAELRSDTPELTRLAIVSDRVERTVRRLSSGYNPQALE